MKQHETVLTDGGGGVCLRSTQSSAGLWRSREAEAVRVCACAGTETTPHTRTTCQSAPSQAPLRLSRFRSFYGTAGVFVFPQECAGRGGTRDQHVVGGRRGPSCLLPARTLRRRPPSCATGKRDRQGHEDDGLTQRGTTGLEGPRGGVGGGGGWWWRRKWRLCCVPLALYTERHDESSDGADKACFSPCAHPIRRARTRRALLPPRVYLKEVESEDARGRGRVRAPLFQLHTHTHTRLRRRANNPVCARRQIDRAPEAQVRHYDTTIKQQGR